MRSILPVQSEGTDPSFTTSSALSRFKHVCRVTKTEKSELFLLALSLAPSHVSLIEMEGGWTLLVYKRNNLSLLV